MLSRSAIVKLKAILIIDLIIVGAAVGAYFYLQDQGLVSGSPKPAEFQFTDLIISPLEAYVGDTVQISVNVTNIGGVEGNTTFNLQINGAIKDTANITLAGNSSDIAAFTDIETAVGTYNVQIGGLNGNFTVKEAPPETSKIVLSDLKVNPFEVWANEAVNVTATATNPTAQADKLTVKMSVDDVVVGSQVVALEAGANQNVVFTVNATHRGQTHPKNEHANWIIQYCQNRLSHPHNQPLRRRLQIRALYPKRRRPRHRIHGASSCRRIQHHYA